MGSQLNPVAALQFEQGINLVLSRWTALQMAVHNDFGGPHSSRIPSQLSLSLISLLTNSKEKVYIEDVVPVLKESMTFLNIIFDDGDFEYQEIAVKLLTMHEECSEGNFNSITRLKEAVPPRRMTSYIPQDDSDGDNDNDNTINEILSNDDSSAMDVDAPKTLSKDFRVDVIDSTQPDDGWTVVGGSRRNRGRRN